MSNLVPSCDPTAPPPPAPTDEGATQQALTRLVAIYQHNLEPSDPARRFLHDHGLSNTGLWSRCQLGYANGTLRSLLPTRGPLQQLLRRLGVLLPNGTERLLDCLVVPVTDPEGRLVNLWGLPTNGKSKLQCLPSRSRGVWNLACTATYGQLLLVDSLLDGLSAQAAGHFNVLALEGHADFDSVAVQTLQANGVNHVLILGDPTWAIGIRAKLPFLRCEQLDSPSQGSLNALLVQHGPAALSHWLASRTSPARQGASVHETLPDGFRLQLGSRLYEAHGLERGPRQLKVTFRVQHAGQLHIDTLDLYCARSRRQFSQDLCRVFGQSANLIDADLVKLLDRCEAHLGLNPTESGASASVLSREAQAAARAFGERTDLVDQILADYEQCGLVGEWANKLLGYLAMTSRKLDQPLAILILSSSGSGKTALQDATLRFCPPEDLVKLTSLSRRALFYKEPTSLKHKVLAVEEGDGLGESSYALRSLISAGELSLQIAAKEPNTGRLVTQERRVEGPVAVFLTTTNPDTDPETKSRFWITSLDESRPQTQAILEQQRREQTLESLLADRNNLAARHWDFQRLLRPLAVVNPYAVQLCFGDDRLQSRRNQPKYLNLIRAIALLRQMQKPVRTCQTDGQAVDYVQVDKEDIRLANRLTAELLGHTLEELSRPGYDLLMQLEPLAEAAGPGFTRRAIREHTGWSYTRVHRYLQELLRLEYVVVDRDPRGLLQTYRLLYQGEGKNGSRFVLGLRSIDQLQDPCTPFAPAFQGSGSMENHPHPNAIQPPACRTNADNASADRYPARGS